MPWTCQKIDSIRRESKKDADGGASSVCIYKLADGREVEFDDLPVGSMWHSSAEPPLSDGRKSWPGDPTICVVLPGKTIWRMNHKGTNGCSWTVTGEIPNVTAGPSINYVGTYHGYVRDGKVTDDVDGRKFDDKGWPV